MAESSWPSASDLTRLGGATLDDDYLYFRVSEGGGFFPYNWTMPRLEDVLTEDQIWRVIAYVQSIAHAPK